MKARIILMVKYPRPGEVKTRLVPVLGARRACELYRAMARHTLEEAQRFAFKNAVSLTAWVANAPDDRTGTDWLGSGVQFRSQGAGDLGQRMERAARDTFAEGAASVIVIGGDCPELSAEHLEAAFRALEYNEVVLGPATDGGYYLLGLRRFVPELFHGIHWGTEVVLEQTLTAARGAGVECKRLDTLHDLDLPEDLPLWAQSAPARAAGKGKISVIVPVLNEAHELARILEAAQRGQPHEIIVVDGGSTDATVATLGSMDTIVLSAPPCRGLQMNRGAAIATGEYLLFLHADTLLPSDYASHIPALLGIPGVVGGAFRFAIACDFAGRRLVEYATNWRARRWQFPYGDQALFVRRETFAQLLGFPEMPIMEDYEFVRRLRKLGSIAIVPRPAITSGRRWQRLGWLRTTLMNTAIILAYHLGVSPSRLARWYRGPNVQARADSSCVKQLESGSGNKRPTPGLTPLR